MKPDRYDPERLMPQRSLVLERKASPRSIGTEEGRNSIRVNWVLPNQIVLVLDS